MVHTEISLFLKNAPGQLAVLSELLGKKKINIDALTIQDASSYVRALFKERGKSLNRIASAASYNSVRRDSVDFALVRLIVDRTDEAINILSKKGYVFDITPVIVLTLKNRPGELAKISKKFGKEKININYVYGSVFSTDKCILVFCPEDIDHASRIFNLKK
ncbi:amino acid-binding protein [Spirochaetota bacterium]